MSESTDTLLYLLAALVVPVGIIAIFFVVDVLSRCRCESSGEPACCQNCVTTTSEEAPLPYKAVATTDDETVV